MTAATDSVLIRSLLMNRVPALLAVTLATTALHSTVSADFVDFDDATGGTVDWLSSDHYRGQGLIFSADAPAVRVADWDPGSWEMFRREGGSGSRALGLANAVGRLSMGASFVIPMTSIATTVDFVSIDVFDANIGTILGVLKGYDASGKLIASVSMITPNNGSGTLAISMAGISRIEFSTDADGALFDNMTFNIASVPTPGALTMLCLAAVVGRRRRA